MNMMTCDEMKKKILQLKKVHVLEQPFLHQHSGTSSAPFYCTLCNLDELRIMDNKTVDNKYFCLCSYWSDPHNAYLDHSCGKWLGWKDEKLAIELSKNYPNEDNYYNKAIDDAVKLIDNEKTGQNT